MKNALTTTNHTNEKTSYSRFVDSLKEETSKVKSMLEDLEIDSAFKSISIPTRTGLVSKSSEMYRSRLEELDQDLVKMQAKILEQKHKISENKKSDTQSSRKIKILEQSLQKSQQKYNDSLSKNKLIKDNIDKLRKEMRIFKNLYKQITASINSSKQQMEKMIEKGSLTIKNRENADKKLKSIETLAETEEKEFQTNLKEVKSLIEKEKKLKNEITTFKNSVVMSLDIKTIESEEEIKSKIVKASWKIAQDKANIIISLNKLEEYEDIIKKFQELTGVSNFESLLKNYEDTKKHNIVLSKYVEDLNNELELLEIELKDVKSKISLFSPSPEESFYSSVDSPIKRYENLSFVNDLEDNIVKINQLFDKIGCVCEDNLEAMSEREKVVAKVACIERRCHEVIEMYSGQSVKPKGNIKIDCKLEVDIPVFQEKDIEDDDSGPLSWKELMSKAAKKAKTKKK